MRLQPRSLLGRNLVLLVALFVISLGSGLLAVREYVQRPRIEHLARILSNEVRSTQALLEALPPDHRQSALERFNGGERLATRADPEAWRQANLLTQWLLGAVRAELADSGAKLVWSPEPGGTLWVRVQVKGEPYWLRLPNVALKPAYPAAEVALLLTALFAVGAAMLIQRRIHRPLQRLAQAADLIGNGVMPAPVSERAPEEIAAVARAFNQMGARLLQMNEEKTVMLAGLSHDLRTPLAKLRLAIEMARKDTDPALIDSMLRSAAEMDADIDQFLAFARAGSLEATQDVEVNELIRDCAARYAQLGSPLELDLQDAPAMPLRPQSIKRALENLIENALRYGGGQVRIESGMQGDAFCVSVMDRGPGIGADEIELLKRPFSRGSNSAGVRGTGLGLAIVDNIVRMHQGRFALHPRKGGGLIAQIQLVIPRALVLGR